MPRPLPKKAHLNHDISIPMDQRPELAVLIAKIATAWSRTEERIGLITIQLLGAEAHTGMRMYQALSSSAAQFAVLRAVARDKLGTAMLDDMEELLSRYKNVARKRNNVIHGHWYISDNHPDELVWVDAADELMGYSRFWSGWNARQDHDERMDYAKKYEAKRPNYLLYDKAELTSILVEVRDLGSALSFFARQCEELNEPSGDETSLRGT